MLLCQETNIMHMKHDASLFVSGLGEKPMSLRSQKLVRIQIVRLRLNVIQWVKVD